jgi:hypothetical protein
MTFSLGRYGSTEHAATRSHRALAAALVMTQRREASEQAEEHALAGGNQEGRLPVGAQTSSIGARLKAHGQRPRVRKARRRWFLEDLTSTPGSPVPALVQDGCTSSRPKR